MKKKIIQQEILLLTASKYCRKQCSTDNENRNQYNTETEHLEDACYNGLLDAMLPEIMEKSSEGKSLYLWNLRHGRDFLQIELSEFPLHIINRFSIDPDLFLTTISRN